jgi:hypothetical protein
MAENDAIKIIVKARIKFLTGILKELVTLGIQNYNNPALERGYGKEDFIHSSLKNDHLSQILESPNEDLTVFWRPGS